MASFASLASRGVVQPVKMSGAIQTSPSSTNLHQNVEQYQPHSTSVMPRPRSSDTQSNSSQTPKSQTESPHGRSNQNFSPSSPVSSPVSSSPPAPSPNSYAAPAPSSYAVSAPAPSSNNSSAAPAPAHAHAPASASASHAAPAPASYTPAPAPAPASYSAPAPAPNNSYAAPSPASPSPASHSPASHSPASHSPSSPSASVSPDGQYAFLQKAPSEVSIDEIVQYLSVAIQNFNTMREELSIITDNYQLLLSRIDDHVLQSRKIATEDMELSRIPPNKLSKHVVTERARNASKAASSQIEQYLEKEHKKIESFVKARHRRGPNPSSADL
eukprot:TRINITY_DN6319_c0_g1_i1.p1 TRINITY_DN6319_c0_g1~~TRINITY_DN6319_c0_g1_i1.p1  ORF type:complete len:329 (+),score=44.05 TRINITY_DN6319_c0_g1_i1:142-1128(+)